MKIIRLLRVVGKVHHSFRVTIASAEFSLTNTPLRHRAILFMLLTDGYYS